MQFSVANKKLSVYVNDSYSSPSIEFETIKKATKIAEWIKRTPELRRQLEICDPASDSAAIAQAISELERYVDPSYLTAIKTGEPASLASSNGLGWDSALYDMVVNSTAGILSALRDVQKGEFAAASLSSGLHHASPNRGLGFCTVNSLAIAAIVAASQGLRVVILDLDAHCGGGTHAYLGEFQDYSNLIFHVDVSVSRFDHYDPDERGSWLELSDEDGYLQALERALEQVAAAKSDIVFYNAGVDIWPTVSPTIVNLRDQKVAAAIRKHGARCVIVMAGGYGSDEDIIPLHLGTLNAFADVQQSTHECVNRCNRCGGRILTIVYGYPTSNAWSSYDRGDVILGGCVLFPGRATSRCRVCGYSTYLPF